MTNLAPLARFVSVKSWRVHLATAGLRSRRRLFWLEATQKMSSKPLDCHSFQNSLIDEFYPANQPLCAKYKKGFGFTTIGHRLPVILTKVIDQVSRDKNDIGEKLGEEAKDEVKDVIGALAKLKNEMVTNKPIAKTSSTVWNEYITKVAKKYFDGDEDEVRWYVGPWLHVECYMYHRMNEAFRTSKYLKAYDPFRQQKEDAMYDSAEPAVVLGTYLEGANLGLDTLQTFLEVSLWGNRCDLSISQGEKNTQSEDIVGQLSSLRSKILANDSEKVWKTLQGAPLEGKNNQRAIGYVLDNSGFELFTDLCLADVLIQNKLADRVDFYVKAQPWFISDVLTNDFHWMLDALAGLRDKPVLSRLGNKWKSYVQNHKFTVVEREFWTYPHAFYEMQEADPSLYEELSSKSFLIFKGDLNYRKLIADTNWDFDTPFVKALQGFTPAPLVALRTLKADCVAGLPPGVGEDLSHESHDWMNTGEYGLIQYAE